MAPLNILPPASNKSSSGPQISEEDLVDEQIDERILRLLGLEDVFDIDYDTYKTLLKERLAAARLPNSKIPADEDELIREEFKRVKQKSGKRFKVAKKKISTNKFLGKKGPDISSKTSKIPTNLLLPPAPSVEKADKEDKGVKKFLSDDLLSALKEISALVTSIHNLLKKQLGLRDKMDDLLRREGEKKRRSDIESGMEERPSIISRAAEKIIKPFTSLFDTIKNFLLNVLLGSLANWLFSVIQNPLILLRPIQGLLDGIFGFFNNIIQWLDDMVVQPVRSFIDILNSAISGFISLVNKAFSLIPGATPMEAPQIPNIPEPPTIEAPNITGEPREPEKAAPNVKINVKNQGGTVIQMKSGGGMSKKPDLKMDNSIAETGGIVSGSTGLDIAGLGPDTQLTALKKNEFVLVPGAASALGIPFLESMNKKYGGNNATKYANIGDINIKTASGGGYIGGIGALRAKYDAKHGKGAYDRESARRRAAANAAPPKKKQPPTSKYMSALKAKAQKGTSNYLTINGLRIPGAGFAAKALSQNSRDKSRTTPNLNAKNINPQNIAKGITSKAEGLFRSFSSATGFGSGRLTPEQQKAISKDAAERNRIIQLGKQKIDAAKNARAEYMKILTNQNHPLYEQAAFGNLSLEKFKQQYKPGSSKPTSKPGFTPYKSKFAGARDAAFKKAQAITGVSKPKPSAAIAGSSTSATSQSQTTLKPSSISPSSSSSVGTTPPPPPSPQSPSLIPLPLPSPGGGGSPSNGTMTGVSGTPDVSFSSVNNSEKQHSTAIKSILGIMEF